MNVTKVELKLTAEAFDKDSFIGLLQEVIANLAADKVTGTITMSDGDTVTWKLTSHEATVVRKDKA